MTKNTGTYKVEVIQVLLDTGCLHNTHDYTDLLTNVAMPTVSKWADRHGYSYRVVRDKKAKLASPAIEKYINFNSDFDYSIVVDADIVLSDTAPSLNFVGDFSACADYDDSKHYSTINKHYSIINSKYKNYINSGLIVLNRDTTVKLCDFVLKNYYRDDLFRDKIWDQHLVNLFLAETDLDINILDLKWNFYYWWLFKDEFKTVKPYGIHYIGDLKKYIGEDLDILYEKSDSVLILDKQWRVNK